MECDLEKTADGAVKERFLDEKTTGMYLRNMDKEKLAKKTLYQNLAILCFSFLLLFSAFYLVQHLQTSIHATYGLANVGLIVQYATFMLSCMFLPPFILSKLGMKKTMLFSMFGYISYTLASFYVSWWTIIPSSVVLGIMTSTLWTGQMTYVTQLARIYSDITGAKITDSCSRFFGLFYAVYFTGDIWGNLASTLVLSYHRRVNVTEVQLGSGYAVYEEGRSNTTNQLVLDNSHVYGFITICLGFGLLAVILMAILLDNLKTTRKRMISSWAPLTDTLRHFWQSGYQKLLAPVTIYKGLSTGFLIGNFSAIFFGFNPGVHSVAYVMICYGISSSLASYVHGVIARLTGYHVPFIVAFILHVGTGIALFIWTPSEESTVPFYALVCLWSIGNAAYSSVLAPLYSNLFPDSTEAAMSSFNLFTSVGWLISFGVSCLVCTYVKLVLILVSLVISTVCVLVVILHDKWYAKPYSMVSAIDMTQRDIGRLTSITK